VTTRRLPSSPLREVGGRLFVQFAGRTTDARFSDPGDAVLTTLPDRLTPDGLIQAHPSSSVAKQRPAPIFAGEWVWVRQIQLARGYKPGWLHYAAREGAPTGSAE
jgi:hypothetical protein